MLQYKIHDASLLTPGFFFFFAVHSTFITETNIISTLALSHQYMQPSWHLLFCLSHLTLLKLSHYRHILVYEISRFFHNSY
jgi:hypothetical protein